MIKLCLLGMVVVGGGVFGSIYPPTTTPSKQFYHCILNVHVQCEVEFWCGSGGGKGGSVNITSATFGTSSFETTSNVCLHVLRDDIISNKLYRFWVIIMCYC